MSSENGNENTKRHDRPYLKPQHVCPDGDPPPCKGGEDDDRPRKTLIMVPGALEDLLADIFD